MAAELVLINPRRAKRRRKGRMPAGLARYWAGKRRKLKAPKRRRRRARARVRATNPRRRRVAAYVSGPRRIRRRKLNPRSHARKHSYRARRRHRNPRFGMPSMSGIKGFVKGTLLPGAIGAGGALALDVAYGYASPYLPTFLQNKWAILGVKLAGAFALGLGASKLLGRERGRAVTLGAVTVVSYGALRSAAQSALPTVPGLSGYTDFVDYSSRMGAYMPPGGGTMGFLSPAATIQPQMGAYMTPGLNGVEGYNWQNDGM